MCFISYSMHFNRLCFQKSEKCTACVSLLNWLFLVQHIMQITKYHRIQSQLTNMNLGKGSQLSQRRIQLLSACLTETRGEKKNRRAA